MKKVFITLSCLLLIVAGLKAQNENLWHDPGFEETETDRNGDIVSKFWQIGGAQIGSFNTETTDVHNGKRAIKLYTSENKDLGMYDDDWDWDRSYPCKVGDNFTLSYWHKGTMKTKGLEVTVRLYDGSNKYSFFKEVVIHNSEVMTQSDKWTQHKVEFKINPEDIPTGKTVKHFDVKLKLPYNLSETGYMFLDDFSLMLTPEKPKETLATPVFEEPRAYEHEIELAWTKSNDKAVSWEVVVNGKTMTTKEPKYTLTQLEDNTGYKVKVRAIKGEIKSDFSEEKTFTTKTMAKSREDVDRLPHLRTIAPDGSVHKQSISLFYNNLYNIKNTKITYKIDGVDAQPEGNILRFPKLGIQELEINIVEDADHTWKLNYKLNVID